MSDDATDRLLTVAREIIEKKGYLGLSMRTAAAAAGVTPEVARRYYRNRDALFAAALRLPVDPAAAIPALVAPGLEGMGERLVRFTLDVLRDPQAREDLMSLARTGVTAGQAALGVQELLERGVIDRVAGAIGVPDARMRSALISSYLLGIAMTRYVVRLDPLASASDEEVIRMVAPVIQDLLDPRKPIPGSARARAASRRPQHESTPRDGGTGSAGTPRPSAASPDRSAGTGQPAAPAPPPPAPHVFDPDPNRSATSSVDLLGAGAVTLGASALRAAAGALRVSSAAAAAARAAAPARAGDLGHVGGASADHVQPPTAGVTHEARPTGHGAAGGPVTTDGARATAPEAPAPHPAPPAPTSSAGATPRPATAPGPAPAKSPAKKSPAKKTPATKTPATKTPATKTPATKSPTKKTPAKKTPATPAGAMAAAEPAASDRPATQTADPTPVGPSTGTAPRGVAAPPTSTPSAARRRSESAPKPDAADGGI